MLSFETHYQEIFFKDLLVDLTTTMSEICYSYDICPWLARAVLSSLSIPDLISIVILFKFIN